MQKKWSLGPESDLERPIYELPETKLVTEASGVITNSRLFLAPTGSQSQAGKRIQSGSVNDYKTMRSPAMSEAKREDRAMNDSTELAYALGKPKSIRYKEALFRNPAALWWTLAAILGWIFSRPGSKKSEVVAPLYKEKYSVPKTASKYGGIEKKRLNLVSMGFELVVAVGMNLLSDHVKTWVAEINASSKKPTTETKTDPAATDPDPSVQNQLKQVNEQLHPKESTEKKDLGCF